eukprot:2038352-Lingulodinium_polyedra.AAC.1
MAYLRRARQTAGSSACEAAEYEDANDAPEDGAAEAPGLKPPSSCRRRRGSAPRPRLVAEARRGGTA